MAAIVNFRDLLLHGAATRYVPPAGAFDPSTLGDLALLDTVGTPQIQPGSITAGSGIVAPGAILTQALAPNAATNTKSVSGVGPTVITPGIFSGPGPEVTLATFPTYGSKGGTVAIQFGMRTIPVGIFGDYSAVIQHFAVTNINTFVVRRNGFLIYSVGQVGFGFFTMPPVIDTTPNGTPVSYTIGVIPIQCTTDEEGPLAWHCMERSAVLLETIR